MSELQHFRTIEIRRCERGFVATVNHDNPAHLAPLRYAFDKRTDLAAWLAEQWPAAPAPAPAAAPAVALHPCETDTRQGVTFIQHAVLDMVEQQQQNWHHNSIFELIDALKRRISSMSPTSSLTDDIPNAIEACALLITIAERSASIVRYGPTGGDA